MLYNTEMQYRQAVMNGRLTTTYLLTCAKRYIDNNTINEKSYTFVSA